MYFLFVGIVNKYVGPYIRMYERTFTSHSHNLVNGTKRRVQREHENYRYHSSQDKKIHKLALHENILIDMYTYK